MEKICTNCKGEKDVSRFSPSKKTKDGLSSWCKDCYAVYRAEHREERNAKDAERRRSNPEREKKRHALYRSSHKEQISNSSARYYLENKEEHKERRAANARRWYHENKDRCIENQRPRRRKKYKEDPNFRLSITLRNRVNMALKKQQKSGSAIRDLGCTIPELREHLESKFQPGMTWENWGRNENCWSIDHIIPLSAFNLTDRQQFVLANYYLNIQPLWSKDNFSKNDKYPEEYLASLAGGY